MSSAVYRPDIDGLRSIAVMSVVLFHADLSLFAGGFAGVDVFFVISGFLITRLIKAALEDNRFSYGDFYLRRARRLFPALFVTLLLVLVVGTLLFLPVHLERLGGALLSALFWCSNVFFWTETGYFDPDAALKPLLHTWSLGVEEQFYLIWPTFLVLLFSLRPAFLLPGIALATLVSFAFAQYLLAYDAAASFYLMPFRVFEFGIGALLVWVVHLKPRTALPLDLCLLAGLGLVAVSFFVFDEHTPFPGWYALVPCLGTALIIFAGQARLAKPLLCNPVAIYLGVISYSLYLVHWPVVVFYKYVSESFRLADKAAVVLIAIALAALMYRFIETPLRRPASNETSPRRFIVGCFVSVALLAAGSAAAWVGKGWPSRWDLPPSIMDMATNQRELRDRSWDLVNNIGGLNPPQFSAPSTDRSRLLLLGDSFSKDLFNALATNPARFDHVDVRRVELHQYCLFALADEDASVPSGVTAQQREDCVQEIADLRKSDLPGSADWILYVARWKPVGVNHLAELQGFIDSSGPAKLAIVGRKAEFSDVPGMAVRYGQVDGLDEHAATYRSTKPDAINARLRGYAYDQGLPYIDLAELACTEDLNACDMTDSESSLLYYDYGHWTLNGAAHFGRKLADSQRLSVLQPGAERTP